MPPKRVRPPVPSPDFVRSSRRRDLLLTMVMVGIVLTPGWLAPPWLAIPWLVTGVGLGLPALYYSWRYAPWVPTPMADLPRVLGLLNLGPDDAFCDLGAGDGRMVIRVHEATGARCTGIEVSPAQYGLARLRLALQGGPGTRMVLADLHRTDLSEFEALYVWGTAYWVGTPEFAQQMQQALRPGARLVSYHCQLSGLTPNQVDASGIRPIYLYVQPFLLIGDHAVPTHDDPGL